MSTQDCFIVMGPFLTFVVGMIVAFGVHHYNTVTNLKK